MNIQDLLQNEVEEVATFRAKPVAWTIQTYESGAGSIRIKLAIISKWHPGDRPGEGEWSNEWPVGYYVENNTNVIKKDGTLNSIGVQGLAKAGIWHGDFDAFEGDPPSVVVIADVKENPYNGNVSYRADYLLPDAEKPVVRGGGFKPVEASVLDQMRARFGNQAKALAGQAPAPTGSPTPPPAPMSPSEPGMKAPF